MIEKNWKEIIKPTKLEIVEDTYSDTYARFNAQPLERGFGVTIGNSLRRILLSSIYGTAIIGVRFDESLGVLHEFSSIPGVYEDVTDIILNFKKVELRMHSDKPQTVTLEKKGPCEVRAADIETGGKIEVVNPDQLIATIQSDMTFKAELRVDWGRGYVPAELIKEKLDSHGWIPNRCHFLAGAQGVLQRDPHHRGPQDDYDRLSLEDLDQRRGDAGQRLGLTRQDPEGNMDVFHQLQEDEIEHVSREEETDKELNNNLFRRGGARALRPLRQLPEELPHVVHATNSCRRPRPSCSRPRLSAGKSREEIRRSSQDGAAHRMKLPDLPSADEIEARCKRMEEEESK
jgi:DNA-directed RNA polymerase subunit alpha